ncbi:MAG: phenylacetate-CoA oxygenase/reductase subunit PaaK, partial [Glutamicibacter sp.]
MTEQTTPTRRRASFHRLTVSNVRRLTKDSIEVSFAIPGDLSEEYDYVAGQYVALRKEIPNAEGELVELRRSYSICAAPTGDEIKVAIKRDLGGLFSTW